MKKIIYAILIIMILTFLAACNDGKKLSGNNTLTEIRAITEYYGSGRLMKQTDEYAHNIIYTTEKNPGESQEMQVLSEKWNLTYDKTSYYQVGSYKVNNYMIEGSKNGSVLLNEDGTIFAILNKSITKLDITPTDTPEKVREALESAISDLVDFSKYEYCKIGKSTPDDSENFGIYNFVYYNLINGYCNGYITVSVNEDGSVHPLWKKDAGFPSSKLISDINKKNEEELIIMKLKDMLNDGNEYLDHEIHFYPNIVYYEDELCVEYSITGHAKSKELDNDLGFACRIIIPIRLLTIDT